MVKTHLHSQEILSLLSDIPDPEIPVITIMELGMLRSVKETSDGYVVTLTPTYTGCPAMGMLEDLIKEKLHEHGIDNVAVEMVYTPAWTTDWLSDEAKEKMRRYGISPPSKTSCISSIGKTEEVVACPHCRSTNVQLISRFGSTACKSLYSCQSCKEPFEHFKCH